MAADEFDKLRTIVIDAAPEEQRKFMGDKLRHANEISLRKRLKQLICPFEDLFGTSSERGSFVGKRRRRKGIT